MPVIGFLSSASADLYAGRLHSFRQGLDEAGYVEGQNLAVEYRWADGQNDRLRTLAADLIRRGVSVVAATDTPSALALKDLTSTLPIVFYISSDPVEAGLVASLNRPGGNLTGVTNLNLEIGPKRVQLLQELVPATTVIALLVNPTNPVLAEAIGSEGQLAAPTLGLQLRMLHASAERDFDAVFATLVQLRKGGLVIGTANFIT